MFENYFSIIDFSVHRWCQMLFILQDIILKIKYDFLVSKQHITILSFHSAVDYKKSYNIVSERTIVLIIKYSKLIYVYLWARDVFQITYHCPSNIQSHSSPLCIYALDLFLNLRQFVRLLEGSNQFNDLSQFFFFLSLLEYKQVPIYLVYQTDTLILFEQV